MSSVIASMTPNVRCIIYDINFISFLLKYLFTPCTQKISDLNYTRPITILHFVSSKPSQRFWIFYLKYSVSFSRKPKRNGDLSFSYPVLCCLLQRSLLSSLRKMESPIGRKNLMKLVKLQEKFRNMLRTRNVMNVTL